jgi:hypothetical protein
MRKAPPKLAMRWAGPSDAPGLLDLFRDAYQRWPRVETAVEPIDHLSWKYEDTGVQSGRFALALDGDRIVGAIPLSTRTFLVDGRPMQSATALDVAVREEYRQFGVYMELQWFSRGEYRNSVDFNFGYAGPHPGMARVREKLQGWKVMPHSIDVLAANATRLQSPAPADASIDIVERLDESIDGFCLEALRPFRLGLLRDHRYLNWRYADARGGGGTLLLARRGTEVAGLAALRVSNGVAYVAELLVLPGRNDVAGALASECLSRARAAGIEKARCWLPERHPYREAIVDAGFSRVKESRAFTYEVLQAPEGSLEFLEDPQAQVHVTIGDTDLI